MTPTDAEDNAPPVRVDLLAEIFCQKYQVTFEQARALVLKTAAEQGYPVDDSGVRVQ